MNDNFENFEKTVETIYIGHDDVTYEARATLSIVDGEKRVSQYDYFDPKTERWVETGERDWPEESILETFFSDRGK